MCKRYSFHVFPCHFLGWTILVFALNFTLSWLFLGVIWYLIAYAHGDIEYFDQMSKADDASDFEAKANHTPCVTEIKTFLSAFLFSLETQHTIGKNRLMSLNNSMKGLLFIVSFINFKDTVIVTLQKNVPKQFSCFVYKGSVAVVRVEERKM